MCLILHSILFSMNFPNGLTEHKYELSFEGTSVKSLEIVRP